ncbi:hypothetical protein GCM10023084_00680 [Streptomyces lacrimifluminis]|uniref:Uncharacterized protein n=1 Tax=Streptomyces lacrimifluminis TaxID=1500077 RepID=A0A917NQK8_9ACTN|nr:hypothetical protein GCM10012282_15760 [Streptomyces lacrimifluminis]
MSDLLAAVGTAQTNIDRLAQPDQLRAAVEQVTEVAHAFGAQTVIAASPVAERLVSAVLLASGGLMRLIGDGSTGSKVLIIDVNLASGTSVAKAARTARHAGADHIRAAVLHQVTDVAAAAADCGVDELVVLNETRPTSWQACGRTTDSGL